MSNLVSKNIWSEVLTQEFLKEDKFINEVSSLYKKYNCVKITSSKILSLIRIVLEEFRDKKDYNKIWSNGKEDIIIAMDIMIKNPEYNEESLYLALYNEYNKKGKENE